MGLGETGWLCLHAHHPMGPSWTPALLPLPLQVAGHRPSFSSWALRSQYLPAQLMHTG